MIGVERLDDADLAEHLAGAADLSALRILEHEHVEVARLRVVLAVEGFFGAGELGDQRAAVGRQVGEAAAGQLGHLVDGAEILAVRRADAEAHAGLPASRRMVSADKAARSLRLSTIRNSSALWILPPRTPIVSTTGTPQAAILLPSHTPPDGCQPMLWPRSAPACLTSLNSASASGVSGLGGRPKPPRASIARHARPQRRRLSSSMARLRFRLDLPASAGAG